MAQATHASPESFIPASKYPAIHRAALETCDSLDGLADGLIADPSACRFDPGVLQCQGADGPGCLTDAQVVAARRIYAPVLDPKTGARVASGLEPGSELQWGGVAGNQPHSIYKRPPEVRRHEGPELGLQDARRRAPAGAGATSRQRRSCRDIHRADTVRDARRTVAHVSRLERSELPPRESVTYYNELLKTMGRQKVAEGVRLFMVPGMGHCGGGDGPNEFDMLAALEQWREHAKAPSEILASQRNEGRVIRTRPLCPYPQIAKYKGSGSVDRAETSPALSEPFLLTAAFLRLFEAVEHRPALAPASVSRRCGCPFSTV